jgi:hypothetical protein
LKGVASTRKAQIAKPADRKQALIRTAVAKTNSNMPLSKITNLRWRHTSGQHVHHLLGFRETAKRSKEEEHGGNPNATGKRLIRAAGYCDQKSAEQQTRDNHHVLHR